MGVLLMDEWQGNHGGVAPISVNVSHLILPFPFGFRQTIRNVLPIDDGVGQPVLRQNRCTHITIDELDFPPAASPGRPSDIPRGKRRLPLR